MTDLEKEWLAVCMRRKDEYVIIVDNDEVFVQDIKSGDTPFLFRHFGWEMVIDLLRYIGCNAEGI